MINSSSDRRLLKLLLGGLGFCLLFVVLILAVISSSTPDEPSASYSVTSTINPSNQPQPSAVIAVPPPETSAEAPGIVIPPAPQEPIDYALTDEIKSLLPIELSVLVKEAILTQPGRIEILTSIIDPRGDDGSMQAQQALTICNAAVAQGYTYVALKENDGTHYALFGHRLYPGNFCSEV